MLFRFVSILIILFCLGCSLKADTLSVLSLLSRAESFKGENLDSMFALSAKALSVSNSIGYKRGIGLSNKSAASALYNKSDYKEAQKLAYRAVSELIQVGILSDAGNALNLLGLIHMSQASYFKADSSFQKSLKYFLNANDRLGIAKAHHNLGIVSFYENKIESSVSYYLQAMHDAELIGNNDMVAQITTNLGLVFSSQRDFGRAILYLKRALKKYSGTEDKKGLSKTFSALGTAFFNQALYDSSSFYHKKALAISNELKDLGGRAESLNNLAEIEIARGRYKTAINYLIESDSLRTISGDAFGLAIVFKNLAIAYGFLGERDIAETYFESALNEARTLSAVWLEAEILLMRSDYYKNIGNYKDALQDYKARSVINDSIYFNQRDKTISELEVQYQADKAQIELELNKSHIELLQKDGRILILISSSVIILSLLGGAFALTLYNRNRAMFKNSLAIAAKNLEISRKSIELEESLRKEAEQALLIAGNEQEQMKAELDYKRKELTQMALYINQQYEILESLKQELSGLKSVEVRKLERELDQKLNIAKQREAFEMNVDLMNEDFYHRLDFNYPQLTENDKKLCAMVRLGLSSKEIASIVNISPKIVDMNRYRLRKKMNLEVEEELGQFLMKI
ncbi:MAG: tetratricopeptide repeat protein [Bacteroidia bacterium]